MVGYKILFTIISVIAMIVLVIFISVIVIITKRKNLLNIDIFSGNGGFSIRKKNIATRKPLNPIVMENSTFFIVQKLDKKYIPNKILQYDLKNLTIFNVKGKIYEIN